MSEPKVGRGGLMMQSQSVTIAPGLYADGSMLKTRFALTSVRSIISALPAPLPSPSR
jgi:hypothetical protein